MNLETKYDVIIIGSGIGALATASLLAQEKKRRILILEQHFKAGGFTHIFRRKQKFLFDVGVHYLGDLQEGSFFRKVFDYVTRESVKFQKMPHVFDKFIFPDFTFSQKSNPEEFQKDLVEMFPQEKKAIRQYFSDIKKVGDWFQWFLLKDADFFPPVVKPFLNLFYAFKKNWANLTTEKVLDQYFKDQKLKAILTSQWGDYGLPPAQSSFVAHALVVQHYLHGGWYPVGGSGKIFQAIKPILEQTQSQILLNHRVKKILVENGIARGVLVEAKVNEDGVQEKIFYGDKIVSNVGVYNTYVNLLEAESVQDYQKRIVDFLKRYPPPSTVILFIGFREDPRKLGFLGENHWIFQSYDHNDNFAHGADYLYQDRDPSVIYLSFPSLKDPEAEGHTAEAITFAPYGFFEKWKNEPWKKRSEDYQNLKEKIAQKLIHFIDKKYPGFANLVEFYELSTPITVEYFSNHYQGAIYGLPLVPERFDKEKSPWVDSKTPIKNLYLTGADVLTPGVGGALLSSLFTFASVEGYESFLPLVLKWL